MLLGSPVTFYVDLYIKYHVYHQSEEENFVEHLTHLYVRKKTNVSIEIPVDYEPLYDELFLVLAYFYTLPVWPTTYSRLYSR